VPFAGSVVAIDDLASEIPTPKAEVPADQPFARHLNPASWLLSVKTVLPRRRANRHSSDVVFMTSIFYPLVAGPVGPA